MSKKQENDTLTLEVVKNPEIKTDENTDELPNAQVTDIKIDEFPNAQVTDVETINLPFTPDLLANVTLLENPINVSPDEILVYKVNQAISTAAFEVLCKMAKIEQEIIGREIIVVPFSAVLKKEKKE